jgi:hypothetical protein
MCGEGSLKMLETPRLSTAATFSFCRPALVPVDPLITSPASASAAATVASAAAPATRRRGAGMKPSRRAGALPVPPCGSGARSSAGACSASWTAAERSPQKSSALGGASGTNDARPADRAAGLSAPPGSAATPPDSTSRDPARLPNGTSSSRGPIQSPSRMTLSCVGAFRVPSFVCGTSLSTR